MVLEDFYPDSSNPNVFLYEFNTFRMKFINNDQVKLDETCQDTQDCFKANLSNLRTFLDGLPPNIMKHEIY